MIDKMYCNSSACWKVHRTRFSYGSPSEIAKETLAMFETKNGKKAWRAVCAECGHNVWKLASKEELREWAEGPIKIGKTTLLDLLRVNCT